MRGWTQLSSPWPTQNIYSQFFLFCPYPGYPGTGTQLWSFDRVRQSLLGLLFARRPGVPPPKSAVACLRLLRSGATSTLAAAAGLVFRDHSEKFFALRELLFSESSCGRRADATSVRAPAPLGAWEEGCCLAAASSPSSETAFYALEFSGSLEIPSAPPSSALSCRRIFHCAFSR